MIRIRDITMQPEHNPLQLQYEAAKLLRITNSEIIELRIVRRSVDARKKPDVKIIYTVDIAVKGTESKVLKKSGCKRASIAPVYGYKVTMLTAQLKTRPIVVGFGPAGMFAALVLAMAGCRPIVLERGEDALTRSKKVTHFFETGELDTRSNVQFGEGGAGTFSDGKLNTGVNNPRIGWILEQFVEAGARDNILYDAKPHVGTDILIDVVQNIRKKIVSLGGEVRFQSQVSRLIIQRDKVTGVELTDGSTIHSEYVVLAIGHSARDTFENLFIQNVPMEAKPFAMGARIEHSQADVNLSQYGKGNESLPPADYKLVQHLDNGTVYTFCMCPGGYVVAAASEEGRIVTNGMSNADRNGNNANAALLVTVNPEIFPYKGPLGGMYWQRDIEARAYKISNSYRAPAQRVGDFLAGVPTTEAGHVIPSYRPGVVYCDLHDCLPKHITDALETALPKLGMKLQAFSDPDAILTAPETRSSCPVRIVRDETRQSAFRGLYPTGEGAGYAGGIMSAAIDGMMTAEVIVECMNALS